MDRDAAKLDSRYTWAITTVDGSGRKRDQFPVSPASVTGGADAGGTVLRNYQEYSMNKAALTWTAAVGTTTPGTVWIGYYDNPEIIYNMQAASYSDAALLALAQQARLSSSCPIWDTMTLSAPMTTRRKRYSVNSQTPTSITEADLQVHGVFIVAVEGTTAALACGHVSMTYSVTGYGLQNNAQAGI